MFIIDIYDDPHPQWQDLFNRCPIFQLAIAKLDS